MHKLKLHAATATTTVIDEDEKTKIEKQNKNPFAILSLNDDSDDDSDDPYAETKEEKEIVKQMSKEDKKKRKEMLEKYEQINNNMYVFPKQTWGDMMRDPIGEYFATQLHKNSFGRKELTIEMFNIDSKRKDLIKQENELSYLIEQNTLRLANITFAYRDPKTGIVPPFELIPATLTDNPNALHHEILSQIKELISIRNQYSNLTEQYNLSREIRDLLNESIMLTMEESALERKLEFAREINSHALRSTILRRKKNLEQVTLDVQTNKNLLNSGKSSTSPLNVAINSDKVNEMFSIRFAHLLNDKAPVIEDNDKSEKNVVIVKTNKKVLT